MTDCPICLTTAPGTLEPIPGEAPWLQCDSNPSHVTRPFTAAEAAALDHTHERES